MYEQYKLLVKPLNFHKIMNKNINEFLNNPYVRKIKRLNPKDSELLSKERREQKCGMKSKYGSITQTPSWIQKDSQYCPIRQDLGMMPSPSRLKIREEPIHIFSQNSIKQDMSMYPSQYRTASTQQLRKKMKAKIKLMLNTSIGVDSPKHNMCE